MAKRKTNDEIIKEMGPEEEKLTLTEQLRLGPGARQVFDWSYTPNPLSRVRYNYDISYAEKLILWMDAGGSYTAFAGVLKMPFEVLSRWEREEPSWQEASAIGEMCYLRYWEEVNRQGASGEIKSNAAAMIFRLKNSFPEMYMDSRGEDKALPTTIIIHTGIDRGEESVKVEFKQEKKQIDYEEAEIVEEEDEFL